MLIVVGIVAAFVGGHLGGNSLNAHLTMPQSERSDQLDAMGIRMA